MIRTSCKEEVPKPTVSSARNWDIPLYVTETSGL